MKKKMKVLIWRMLVSTPKQRRKSCRSGIFFFQAEDGIRDGTVTGVQTCALPISSLHGVEGLAVVAAAGGQQHEAAAQQPGPRSEERRVGKECRSRWSPCH